MVVMMMMMMVRRLTASLTKFCWYRGASNLVARYECATWVHALCIYRLQHCLECIMRE